MINDNWIDYSLLYNSCILCYTTVAFFVIQQLYSLLYNSCILCYTTILFFVIQQFYSLLYNSFILCYTTVLFFVIQHLYSLLFNSCILCYTTVVFFVNYSILPPPCCWCSFTILIGYCLCVYVLLVWSAPGDCVWFCVLRAYQPQYISVCSIVSTNILLWVLSYLVVSSLRMVTNWNR
jgi:hypothetical protein